MDKTRKTKITILILGIIAIACFVTAGSLYFWEHRDKPKTQYQITAEYVMQYIEETYPETSQDPALFSYYVNEALHTKVIIAATETPPMEKKIIEECAKLTVEKFPEYYSGYGWKQKIYENGTIDYMMILNCKDSQYYTFTYFGISEKKWTQMHSDGSSFEEVPILDPELFLAPGYRDVLNY